VLRKKQQLPEKNGTLLNFFSQFIPPSVVMYISPFIPTEIPFRSSTKFNALSEIASGNMLVIQVMPPSLVLKIFQKETNQPLLGSIN